MQTMRPLAVLFAAVFAIACAGTASPPIPSTAKVADAGSQPPDSAQADLKPVDPSFPRLAASSDAPAPHVRDIGIVLQRSPCYGQCPCYTVTIRGDGSVSYDGVAYVMLAGHADTRIDPSRLVPILRKMEAMDIVHHRHDCPITVNDTSATSLTLRVGSESRTVEDQLMGLDFGPDFQCKDPAWHAAVLELGDLVDELVDIQQWIGQPSS